MEDASLSLENSDDREVEPELWLLDPDLDERMLEVSEPISDDRFLELELA